MSKAGAEAGKVMSKAGDLVEDGVITVKLTTALLADPDVKGLRIDLDTKDGVVTLEGTADKAVNLDRAVRIAKETGGVKSVDNQLVVKSSGWRPRGRPARRGRPASKHMAAMAAAPVAQLSAQSSDWSRNICLSTAAQTSL